MDNIRELAVRNGVAAGERHLMATLGDKCVSEYQRRECVQHDLGNHILDANCVHEDGAFHLFCLPDRMPNLFTLRFTAPEGHTAGDKAVVKGEELAIRTPDMLEPTGSLFAAGAVVHCDVDWERKLCFIEAGGVGGSIAGPDDPAAFPVKALTADTDFYVGLNGSDTDGDGSIGNPWATVYGAFHRMQSYFGCGHTATIKILDGVYEMNDRIYIWEAHLPGGRIRITSASGDPAKVTLNWSNAAATGYDHIICTQCVFVTIDSITMRIANMGTGQTIVKAEVQSYILSHSLVFELMGGMGRCVFFAANSSCITIMNGTRNYIEIKAVAGMKMESIFFAITASNMHLRTSEARFSGTIQLTVGFAHVATTANILLDGTPTQFTGGTITGPRYHITRCGVCSTNGQGATYFPGNAAGTTATGGVYA